MASVSSPAGAMSRFPTRHLHAKPGIEKIGADYACGKVDAFSAAIALRYLLHNTISGGVK